MANGNITISAGSTLGVITPTGSGLSFLDALYKYANLTLPYSPNDPGLQYTYDNSTLAPSVFLYARFFNLLNEPSSGVLVDVGTEAFLSGTVIGACLDVRDFGAIGDGVTDDTDAIQAALDQAEKNAVLVSALVAGTAAPAATPVVLLNGWGPNGHVGQYEHGIDQNHNFFGLDAGTTLAYALPGSSVAGNQGAYASVIQHTHQYAGLVFGFTSGIAVSGTNATLVIQSAAGGLFGAIANTRSASLWYSLDNGSTWAMIYDSPNRAMTIDQVRLPDGQDFSKVQVLAFNDGHDDMAHYILPPSITTTALVPSGKLLPTTVCIEPGVNCLVSYRSVDMCTGVWYSQGHRCLTIGDNVTLKIDGSIIKKKETLSGPATINPPQIGQSNGSPTDGVARIVTLNGLDAGGNPATDTLHLPGNGATVVGTVIWSRLDSGTVNIPIPGNQVASNTQYISPLGTFRPGTSVMTLPVYTPISQKSFCVLNPPTKLAVYAGSVGDVRHVTLTGLDATGSPVTETVTTIGQTVVLTSNTFSQLYSGTVDVGRDTADIFVGAGPWPIVFGSPDTNNFSITLGSIGGGFGGSGVTLNASNPGCGWVIENKNAFVPFGQFQTLNGPSRSPSLPMISQDYQVAVVAAKSGEGYRNTGIRITGIGKVYLNGAWVYRNASEMFGLFAYEEGMPHIGFARFCACDNSIIENIEIIEPCRSAIHWLHSEGPLIQNIYIHDGHGDDAGVFVLGSSAFVYPPIDAEIVMDFCRNLRLLQNRIYNCLWGGIFDYASYQSFYQQNDMQYCRQGYTFFGESQEMFIDFGTISPFLIQADNEISGNRAVQTHAFAPSQNLGVGFEFIVVDTNITGMSFHDNVANNNDIDFTTIEFPPDETITWRALYNNAFSSTALPIINGQQQVTNETPSGLVNGTNTVFTLAHTPVAGSLNVQLNGLGQTLGVDYTLSGNTITFTTAPPLGTTLSASYRF